MSLPKVEDARKLSDEELAEEILAVKRQLFELRLQQATSELKETHRFKHTRHRLAQLMTVERERQTMEGSRVQGTESLAGSGALSTATSDTDPQTTNPSSETEKEE